MLVQPTIDGTIGALAVRGDVPTAVDLVAAAMAATTSSGDTL